MRWTDPCAGDYTVEDLSTIFVQEKIPGLCNLILVVVGTFFLRLGFMVHDMFPRD